MSTKSLEHKIDMLPPELQKEAADFIDFLLTRKTSREKEKAHAYMDRQPERISQPVYFPGTSGKSP